MKEKIIGVVLILCCISSIIHNAVRIYHENYIISSIIKIIIFSILIIAFTVYFDKNK